MKAVVYSKYGEADVLDMNKLFETGKVKPVLDGPFNLSEVPEALKYFEDGNHKGKIIITMD